MILKHFFYNEKGFVMKRSFKRKRFSIIIIIISFSNGWKGVNRRPLPVRWESPTNRLFQRVWGSVRIVIIEKNEYKIYVINMKLDENVIAFSNGLDGELVYGVPFHCIDGEVWRKLWVDSSSVT